jgi:hypothetical protein
VSIAGSCFEPTIDICRQHNDREDSGDVEEVHRERPARRDLILEGMLPEQDWSMVMTKPQQRDQAFDDFGATLLKSLGDPQVDNASAMGCLTLTTLTGAGHLETPEIDVERS